MAYDIGLIRSRDDTGGWCDANLYVEKAKIINTDETEMKLLKARDGEWRRTRWVTYKLHIF